MISLSLIVRSVVYCLMLASCSSLNTKIGHEDDWWGEELSEEVIESFIQSQTGYRPNIDLTPSTPEK